MFVREKRIGPYSYLYLVESVREDGKNRQRIIHTLGCVFRDKSARHSEIISATDSELISAIPI
jgi:hypothetical protein